MTSKIDAVVCDALADAIGPSNHIHIAQIMENFVQSKYIERGPSYLEYRSDQAMFKQVTKAFGLSKTSDHLQRAYREAVRTGYGRLPVCPSLWAVQKRRQRR